MSIRFNVNRDQKEVDVYHNEVLLETLTGEEAHLFLQRAEKEAKENVIFFQPLKKITIEDIEALGCPIEELEGLEFEPIIITRGYREAHMAVKIIKEDEEVESIYLTENFTQEQLYFGPITNHHIRACLSDELIEHILDVPEFDFGIDSPYRIFDEETTYYYKADED